MFKLTVMCNSYSISVEGCTSKLKIYKLKLCCSLDDRADFCIVCHLLDQILIDKIHSPSKFFVNNVCRPVT